MSFLYTVAFLLMLYGIFLYFQTSPMEFLEQLAALKKHKKLKMKDQIKQSIKPKKIRGIQKIIQESRETLQQENQINRFSQLCIISIALGVLGVLIASSMNNIFLVPVLGAGLALLPFLYVLLMSARNRKNLNASLESALSIITSSYIRTESIILAIRENMDQIDPKIRPVFQKFLIGADMINPDVTLLLTNMKKEINSNVFHEWVDELILCQDNRNLKSSLLPIVNKLSDIRIVSGELDYLMYDPLKEFSVLALLVILEIPFIRSQNEEWYKILMYTPVGQFLIAVDALVLLVSLVALIRNTRPVEYRR